MVWAPRLVDGASIQTRLWGGGGGRPAPAVGGRAGGAPRRARGRSRARARREATPTHDASAPQDVKPTELPFSGPAKKSFEAALQVRGREREGRDETARARSV